MKSSSKDWLGVCLLGKEGKHVTIKGRVSFSGSANCVLRIWDELNAVELWDSEKNQTVPKTTGIFYIQMRSSDGRSASLSKFTIG